MKKKLMNALSEPLKEINVTVSDIVFEKEDGIDTLFIKIEGENEVDTDLCTKASEIINPIIDSLNIEELNGEYVLDICSKGVTDEQ